MAEAAASPTPHPESKLAPATPSLPAGASPRPDAKADALQAAGSVKTAERWLIDRIGQAPNTALGWFRAGVGFYNKHQFEYAIDCFQKSVALDPLNYNAFQIMARACIAVNRREDAIEALRQSVKLDNPSDWQLLVELTSNHEASANPP
ncbi:Tetratricopeptide repeat [Plasmodiophora brassicae]|uniref:Uncharacterized protein n=2 Tax=Plasmodiophora brassicae TaxID=37360 RepID=A0A3P3Y2F5_PLABS|nr:unnamed protein product [Plasmodiophora brassicae]